MVYNESYLGPYQNFTAKQPKQYNNCYVIVEDIYVYSS